MKSTLLAAVGQLNLNIEQRAKQGHRKQSVQLYSRDDVWPSLFLQWDILIDIGTGWRPLTSQARGAKQPLPEPEFTSPPITDADLQLMQMLAPTAKEGYQKHILRIQQVTLNQSHPSLMIHIHHPRLAQTPALPLKKKPYLKQMTNHCWWSTKSHTWCMQYPLQIPALLNELVLLWKEQPLRLIVGPQWWESQLKQWHLFFQVHGYANARRALQL